MLATLARILFAILAGMGCGCGVICAKLIAMSTPHIDHPRAHELAEQGRARTSAHNQFLHADRATRKLVIEILKDDPDLRREDLATVAGLGVDVVKRLATEAGVPSPRTKAKTKERTDAAIAAAMGQEPTATTAELAHAVGVSSARITSYLREHQLPARPRTSSRT